VFVVNGGAWGEVMIPAVGAIVRELSPSEGRIVVDADGLGLDDEPPVRRPRGRRTTKAVRAGTPLPGQTVEEPSASVASEGAPPDAA
jgi:hypothetical protein